MDNDFGFGFSHRHKRTHAQMDHEGSSSPPWPPLRHLSVPREHSNGSPSRPQHSNLQLPRVTNMPATQPRRFPGDGFDYRRPVLSSMSDSQVIDLTADDAGPSASTGPSQAQRTQRPPRFAREIIDVDEEDARQSVAAPASPEIEFISSRRIAPGPQEQPAPRHSNPEEDELEFIGARSRQHEQFQDMVVNVWRDMIRDDLVPPAGHLVHLRAQFQRFADAARMRPAAPPRAAAGARAPHVHIGFVAPTMDFDMVGFDMGLGGGPAPTPPTYNAPEPAPEGFTRSAAETDVLVCPNCEEELCVGDSEVKRQVWIVKTCGHVYCGECTANRSVRKSAKGKDKATPAVHRPFKQCVVEGCDKKVANPRTMIQVFL